MELYPPEAIIALAACVLAVIAMFYGLLCSKKLTRLSHTLQTEIKRLDKQVSIVASGSIGLGQRVMLLEQHLRDIQDVQADIRQNDVDFSYTQAQKLIEQGVDTETIAANSGLSASEVSLMQLMNGR